MVALKTAGGSEKKAVFILADVQSVCSFTFTHAFSAFSKPLFPLISSFGNDILRYAASPCSMRRCFKSPVSRHFRRSK